MTISTVGDMRQHFMMTRNNSLLKADLNTLVGELTSGRAADLTAHLGANQTNLAGVDRKLEMLSRFASSNSDTGQMLTMMQTVLDAVDSQRSVASGALIAIDAGSLSSQILDAGNIARGSFAATVQTLNARYGDRALFGGNELNVSPLGAADDMLTSLKTAVSGLSGVDDIKAALDTWFDTPGGGFETLGYQGDTAGVMSRSLDGSRAVDISVRADDQAIRDTLKAFAMGALAGDTTVFLNTDTRQLLQRQAGVDLVSVSASLTGLQARLGHVEGQVEEAAVRTSAQLTSFGIARNDMVSVDPFETATRLQAVQQQLEIQFTLTARLSRLSLTEYLR